MNAVPFLDDLVKEYLLFRGYVKTFTSFSSERSSDKTRFPGVDSIADQLLACIRALDFEGFSELWETLDTRFFKHLPQEFTPTIRSLNSSLKKAFLVKASKTDRKKLINFFEKFGERELSDPSGDWEAWFGLPYLTNPSAHPKFELFFTKKWFHSLSISLKNFLATVLDQLPLPKLLAFNIERLERKAAMIEIKNLRQQIKDLTNELASARSELQALRETAQKTERQGPIVAQIYHDTTKGSNNTKDDYEVPFSVQAQEVLLGHTGVINKCRFSADGSRVATASNDGTVRVWTTGNLGAGEGRRGSRFCSSSSSSASAYGYAETPRPPRTSLPSLAASMSSPFPTPSLSHNNNTTSSASASTNTTLFTPRPLPPPPSSLPFHLSAPSHSLQNTSPLLAPSISCSSLSTLAPYNESLLVSASHTAPPSPSSSSSSSSSSLPPSLSSTSPLSSANNTTSFAPLPASVSTSSSSSFSSTSSSSSSSSSFAALNALSIPPISTSAFALSPLLPTSPVPPTPIYSSTSLSPALFRNTVEPNPQIKVEVLDDVTVIQTPQPILSVEWDNTSDNGSSWLLGFGSSDARVRLWNTQTTKLVFEAVDCEECPCVIGLSFSPTDSLMVTSSATKNYQLSEGERGQLSLWDLPNGKRTHIFGFDSKASQVNHAQFNHNGNMLVTGGADGMVRVFDMVTHQSIMGWPAHLGQVASVRFSSNETAVMSVGLDGKVFEWSLHRVSKLVRAYSLPYPDTFKQQPCVRTDLAMDNSEEHFVVSGSHEQTCSYIYHVSEASPIQALKGHATQVTTVDWHPTRSIVISASADHTARITTLVPQSRWYSARGLGSRDSRIDPLMHSNLLF